LSGGGEVGEGKNQILFYHHSTLSNDRGYELDLQNKKDIFPLLENAVRPSTRRGGERAKRNKERTSEEAEGIRETKKIHGEHELESG